jgi:hypothetical protein
MSIVKNPKPSLSHHTHTQRKRFLSSEKDATYKTQVSATVPAPTQLYLFSYNLLVTNHVILPHTVRSINAVLRVYLEEILKWKRFYIIGRLKAGRYFFISTISKRNVASYHTRIGHLTVDACT